MGISSSTGCSTLGADASVPLYSFVFLVALGIDFTIFLMRAREESISIGLRRGMVCASR